MFYSHWEDSDVLKQSLKKINERSGVEKSGIPLLYDEDNLYIEDNNHHTLIIGSSGSGKTQSVVLPQIKLSILAGESIFVTDYNGEIYENIKSQLDKNNYKTYVINLNNKDKGNNWNPLQLPYKLYKNGKKDDAIDLLYKIGKQIFYMSDSNGDEFWETSAIQYFVGVTLYLFEKANIDEINLNSIYNLAIKGEKDKDEFIKSIDDSLLENSFMYSNLLSILNLPIDTRGGVLAVFKQGLNMFVERESLSSILANNDFDMDEIVNEKIAIFFVGRPDYFVSRLVPMLFSQLYFCIEMNDKREKRFNLILDDFIIINRIDDFSNILNYCRSLNIKVTICVTGFSDLEKNYKRGEADIIRNAIGNIIYLLSNDLYTLKEISSLCGNYKEFSPRITKDELRYLKPFEAIVLIPRKYPVRTKLIPDYQIKWPFKTEKSKMFDRVKKEYKIFSLK